MEWLHCNWHHLASLLVSLLAVSIFFFGLTFAIRQAREATRSRELNATTQLLLEIGDEDVRKDRSYILSDKLSISEDGEVSDKDLERIRFVAVRYDRVGYMINNKLLPHKALYEFQSDEIRKLWEKIEPAIERFRDVEKRPNYCRHFQILFYERLPEWEEKFGSPDTHSAQ